MREAFSYMFKDNKYKNKALTYFVFAMIANFCSIYANTFAPSCSGVGCHVEQTISPEAARWLFLGVIISLIPLGYHFSCIKALIEQKENFVLPNFNLIKNFVQGLKYFFNIILAVIVYGLGFAIVAILLAIIASLTGLKVLSLMLLAIISILLFAGFSILSLAFFWIFANTGWLTTLFRVQRAYNLVKTNRSTYWLALGLMILLGIVVGLVSIVAPILGAFTGSSIAASLIAAFLISILAAYTTFVSAFIIAKAVKPVEIPENKNIVEE